MKFRFILPLAILIMSCGPSKQEQNTKTETKQEKTGLFCFYKMDNKNSTEESASNIKQWLISKSTEILVSDSVVNLFNHNGGGPAGAEWNPGTDIFIAALGQKTIQIQMNDSSLSLPYFTYNKQINWYKIPYQNWISKGIDGNSYLGKKITFSMNTQESTHKEELLFSFGE